MTAPKVVLVLGSGLGAIVQRVRRIGSIPFAAAPELARPSVIGHRGRLTIGKWDGVPVLVFEGRAHFYEGHPWRAIEASVVTAQFLGCRTLVVTNAAGGIDGRLAPGSVMGIDDHIEWTRPYCWKKPRPAAGEHTLGSPYSPRLLEILVKAALDTGLPFQRGVYATVTGPSYETPAEIRALKVCGAHAVGMSTAREIQAGFALGMECVGLSCITNWAAGLSNSPIDHREVLEQAAAQTDRIGDLLQRFLYLAQTNFNVLS